MIVVDASLVAKLVISEHDSEAARDWIQAVAQIAAPDLLISEVTSAVVRRVNMRDLARTEGLNAIKGWLTQCQRGVISFHRLTPLLVASASEIAVQIGHPLSDCIYLALACDLDCDLITCDAVFCDKAYPAFGRVRLLGERAA